MLSRHNVKHITANNVQGLIPTNPEWKPSSILLHLGNSILLARWIVFLRHTAYTMHCYTNAFFQESSEFCFVILFYFYYFYYENSISVNICPTEERYPSF